MSVTFELEALMQALSRVILKQTQPVMSIATLLHTRPVRNEHRQHAPTESMRLEKKLQLLRDFLPPGKGEEEAEFWLDHAIVSPTSIDQKTYHNSLAERHDHRYRKS